MSAFISLLRPDRIEIMTDAALTDKAGTLVGIAPKFHQFHDLPMVIACKGSTEYVGAFVHSITPRASDSVDRAVQRIESVLASMRFFTRFSHREPCVFLIAGWTSAGPRHWLITTGKSGLDVPEFVLHPLDDHLAVCGNLGEAEMRAAGLPLWMLEGGLEHHGPRFFQAFRRPVEDCPFGAVGGQLQLTTIRPDGVDLALLDTGPISWAGRYLPIGSLCRSCSPKPPACSPERFHRVYLYKQWQGSAHS